jgi:hypothetical protein
VLLLLLLLPAAARRVQLTARCCGCRCMLPAGEAVRALEVVCLTRVCMFVCWAMAVAVGGAHAVRRSSGNSMLSALLF